MRDSWHIQLKKQDQKGVLAGSCMGTVDRVWLYLWESAARHLPLVARVTGQEGKLAVAQRRGRATSVSLTILDTGTF